MTEGPTQTPVAAPAPPPARPKKALVIDDYYARPTSAELSSYIPTLRQFITDNPASGVKEWFDSTFGLSGDHKRGDYFDPLLNDGASIRRFWAMRDESPVGVRLSGDVFSTLVSTLHPAQRVLRDMEARLAAEGWVVRPEPALPSVASVERDISFIAIDYILVPGQPAQGLEKSLTFLREVLAQCKAAPSEACPFVLLMSENPDAERNAERVRKEARLHSAYFRFAKKAELSPTEVQRIVGGFIRQQPELENYRKLHVGLTDAFVAAADSLRKTIDELELQDLATLHAGQLVQEGEPLSDYLAWLYGQYLSAHMMRHRQLGDRTANLPATSHRVLLGHLSANDNIPKLFAAVSLTVPASAEKYKVDKGKLQVRFGDLFVYQGQPANPPGGGDSQEQVASQRVPASTPSIERYLLVISQTCDLYHRNITNGQVLCLDGDAHELTRTEADLLRATIRQMDQQGRILHKGATRYFEVEWRPEDLRTIEEEKLATETGYRYLGRLNELYALQAQHSALDRLGRIGVPIQPSYSIYFKKVTLKVFEGPKEIPELAGASSAEMVVAVLRNEKAHTPVSGKATKSKHRLLFSDELRNWLVAKLQALSGAEKTPSQLKLNIDQFRQSLEQRSDYSLIVKVQKETTALFQQEKVGADGTVDASADLKDLSGGIAIELSGVFDAPVRTNTRIELVFEKV